MIAPEASIATVWTLEFTVRGTPAGQGRVSFLGKGRPAVHSNRKTLMPWRAAVIAAAATATDGADIDYPLTAVPVQADIAITVAKPKSAPKRRRTWPITRSSSDLDHHIRAVLDSLTHAGVLADDSMVVELSARKVYPGEHADALDAPGARVRVRPLPEVTR